MAKTRKKMIYVVQFYVDYEGLCEPVMSFTNGVTAQKYADKLNRDEQVGKHARYVVNEVELRDE